jgi:hypothetical protein
MAALHLIGDVLDDFGQPSEAREELVESYSADRRRAGIKGENTRAEPEAPV